MLKTIATSAVLLILLLVSTPFGWAQTAPPVIYFTDLTSGPNSGGENGNGTILTIYGRNFGATRGTSTVTIGGGTVAAYDLWGGRSKAGTAAAQLETISVAIGASAATGTVVVTTSAGPSTCENTQDNCQFTVRTGNIYCVATTGSDSNTGLFPSSCFLTVVKAKNVMVSGDIVYIENGVTSTVQDNQGATLFLSSANPAGSPKAFVAYPGATVTFSSTGMPTSAIRLSGASYDVLAGLIMSGTGGEGLELSPTNSNIRIVNNEFTCPQAGGQAACAHIDTSTNIFFYGNWTHNVGDQHGSIDKFYHANYFTTNSNHIWYGWNEVNNNPTGSTTSGGCRGLQFFSTGGANQFDLHVHDNYIHNTICDGINFATVDPAQGTVEAYNNIVFHAGTGPDPGNSPSNYSCVLAGGGTTGNVLVYNNTFYDCGGRKTADAGALDPTTPGIIAKNNIFYQLSGESYINPNGNAAILSGSNNVWFGLSTPPSQTTGNITTDPLFTALGTNFTLQSGSPAIGSGTNTQASTYDFSGTLRPNPPTIGAFDIGVPTFIYSNAGPLAIPSGTNWGVASPCGGTSNCERIPLDPNVVTAGSTIVLSFGHDNSGSPAYTVTDDKGNTYNLDVSSAVSNNKALSIYHASNVAAGVNYIQILQSAGGNSSFYWQPHVAIFYNVGALDASSCSTATSATISAGSLTPTQVGDLIFQSKYTANTLSGTAPFGLPIQTASFTAGSQANITWTLAAQLLGDAAADQYGVYGSTAAINPTFTQAASDSYISCAVALKATLSGTAPAIVPRVIHQEHDAMPHNAANPWVVGIVVDVPNSAVYLSRVGNDPITNVTSVPAPTVGWTASGADFNGPDGHNHVNYYCASWTTPPGTVQLSITRGANGADGIDMMYVVQNGTCNLDVDSGGQGGNLSAQGPLTTCTNCLTPTKQNDFIMFNGGQNWCTATGLNPPTGGVFDAVWFTGNTLDGPTQTDENNFWGHFYNGTSLSPFTVTWPSVCDHTHDNWGSRVVAYQVAATGAPTVSLNPASLSYGNQPLGSTSAAQTVTLTNNGTASLVITSVSLTGTNLGDYAISANTCGSSLSVSNSCTVSVTFTPSAPLLRTASLTFTTNAASSPDNVTLSGTGTTSVITGNGSITGNGTITVHP